MATSTNKDWRGNRCASESWPSAEPGLAEALALSYDDARRDELMDEALESVPDELLVEVAREAAGHLWLSQLGRQRGQQ